MEHFVKTCAWYVAEAKRALGNERISDRELGELLGGFSQSLINRAKRGNMSNPIAFAIAHVTKIEPGEILLVAKTSRAKDSTLLDYIAKTFSVGQVGAL